MEASTVSTKIHSILVPTKFFFHFHRKLSVLDRLQVFPNKAYHIRFKIIGFLPYPPARQQARCTVSLQGAFTAIHHKAQILIVKQFFAVNHITGLCLPVVYHALYPVDPANDLPHPLLKNAFIHQHKQPVKCVRQYNNLRLRGLSG
jgi:hypothetical protein